MSDPTEDQADETLTGAAADTAAVYYEESYGPDATEEALYGALCRPFSEVHLVPKQGTKLAYLAPYQVLTRLNETFGVGGWSFTIISQQFIETLQAFVVHGRLKALIRGEWIERDQMGGSTVKRRRDTNEPMDVGDDVKAATTEALKKCAMAFGVGLYLSERDGVPTGDNGGQQTAQGPAQRPQGPSRPAAAPGAATASGPGNPNAEPGESNRLFRLYAERIRKVGSSEELDGLADEVKLDLQKLVPQQAMGLITLAKAKRDSLRIMTPV